MVAQLLLSLTILVFVHELGHFLAAKFFKTKVERFYLFFDFLFPMPHVLNFALWKKKIGDTEYGIGWFPLGGYVSIAGMVDETQDANQLASEPQPWEYRSKKGWQKMIIILGGIIFNIIFGIMIFSAILKFSVKEFLPISELKNNGVFVSENGKKLGFKDGDIILKVNNSAPERFDDLTPINTVFGGDYLIERQENNEIVQKTIELPKKYFKQFDKGLFAPYYHKVSVVRVSVNSNAEKAGLKANDIISTANGTDIKYFNLFKAVLDSNRGRVINLTVQRNESKINLKVLVDSLGIIGFNPGMILSKENYKLKTYSILQAIKYASIDCMRMFWLQAINIVKMAQGEVKFKESVGGPIEMAQAFGSKWDWLNFWSITCMISIGLAFMNLLPIPALDGGHAVVIIIEMITGKPVNEKVLQILQTIGTVIILLLMVFVFYNGISKMLK